MTHFNAVHIVIIGTGIILAVFLYWNGLELIPEEKRVKNNPRIGLRRLKKRINRTHHHFYMVSDCGCSTIFNEPKLAETLEYAHERKVDVRFILLQPKIFHAGDEQSPLLDLARQNKVGLAIAPPAAKDEYKNHFQVSDISVYIEDPHPSIGEEDYTDHRSGVWKKNNGAESKEYTYKFLALWEESDRFQKDHEPQFDFLVNPLRERGAHGS